MVTPKHHCRTLTLSCVPCAPRAPTSYLVKLSLTNTLLKLFSFPLARLKFFNKDPKDGERYRGARDEDALQTFINTQLKGPQEKQVQQLPLLSEMFENNKGQSSFN